MGINDKTGNTYNEECPNKAWVNNIYYKSNSETNLGPIRWVHFRDNIFNFHFIVLFNMEIHIYP